MIINRKVVMGTAKFSAIAVAISLVCVLAVMSTLPDGGRNIGLAIGMAVVIPLLCMVPVGFFLTSQAARLEQLNDLLAHEASHDSLTELPNRRMFLDQIEQSFDAGEEAAVLLIDADRFKAVNDEHGHHTGDEALKAMARLFIGVLPYDALVARLGGEEFGLLLPGATLAQAQDVAERVRRAVENHDFRSPEGICCPLTVSIGIDLLRMKDRGFPMRGADFALYAAKEAGRNRISYYAPPGPRYDGEKAA